MTRRRESGRVFRVRAAGVAIRDGCVLVHREEQPSPWTNSALPGGGVEMHETSDAALVREFREELGVDVRVGRLLWVVDNRFRHDGEEWHEIGFYWEVLVEPALAALGMGPTLDRDSWLGRECRLHWAWHPLDRLAEIELRPSLLVEGLRDLPKSTRFLVHGDAGIPTGP
jgi:ADP-ribose pyrophosphatase YjhB (NUDIX family)